MVEKEKIREIVDESQEEDFDDSEDDYEDEEDNFEDTISEISGDESNDYESEEDDMVLFKENPLKAIFLQNKEILEILNSLIEEDDD